MLKIPKLIQRDIEAHGVAEYPYEGCGLLLGHVVDGDNVVAAIELMANVWPLVEERRERFRIDPRAWFSAEISALDRGLDVIGIFHSHPDHPPIASPRDLEWASWPGYSYLITEVRDGEVQGSRSWQLSAERTHFNEEEIEIS